ncbi:MAG TPA: thiamine pyrophosphate-dependent enzyme [Bryobacteraceae bacterium]|nr:thiamine pyrophosphate-dependent enzyme [Bryobacteraceae bacterium]
MEKTTASDILIEALADWGVTVIFGLPGDGINGIMEALRKRQDRIRFIQVRHEESAAFMACAYAKYTGKLGVCLATSGPGGIHLLNGLYDAKGDGQPVLAITGMHYHDLIHTFAQQDIELDKVFMDVAHYNARVMGPAHVENVVDLACRTALTYRTVSHITIPADIQEQEPPKKGSKHNVLHHTSDVYARGAGRPSQRDLEAAAALLAESQKIAILAGRGALGATDELLSVAELLGAPIAKALLGKASIPDDSRFTTGSIGLLGTTASDALMQGCDALIMVGTSFPYTEYLPKPGQARCIQIDSDPARIGLRCPVEVGIVGDAAVALKELRTLLKPRTDRSFLEQIQEQMRDWREAQLERETSTESPMKPQMLAAELGACLPDNAILSVDSGTSTVWWARHVPAKRGQMHSVSGIMASMACGLSYAIAAQIAHPDRTSVAFVGDGGFAMLMAEFATCVKYQLPVKVIVVKNNSYAHIKWEQMMFLGNPEYGCELHPIDFAAFARACGAVGFSLKDPARCRETLREALATPGPVLVEAEVDPLEAPFFANLKPEQAKMLKEALQRGEPDSEGILANARETRARELV